MTEPKIQPATITKPMQLLAAWLVGLLAIDGCFLLAASHMPQGSAQVAELVWAAILNVPLFILALFLLQTRFRPELQEDLYYSTYINQKTNQSISITRTDQRMAAAIGKIERVENLLETTVTQIDPPAEENIFSTLTFGVNKTFEDSKNLSQQLFAQGVTSHKWFGAEDLPTGRYIAISEHMLKKNRDEILKFASKLGFTTYNLIDEFEEIDEDVLIGSYIRGEPIPQFPD